MSKWSYKDMLPRAVDASRRRRVLKCALDRMPEQWGGLPVAASPTGLVIEPLSPRLWASFEDLLDDGGPAGRCWCMAPRIGADYRRQAADENRDAFRQIVRRGPPPGLIALDGELAVGWCQLTPRASVPGVERGWRTRRVDDTSVWLISCLYVRKGHRRRGITAFLIDHAVEYARAAGAPGVEAYPLDGTLSRSSTDTGYATTFATAGFVEIARRSPERPIMRLTLTQADLLTPTEPAP